MLKGMSAKRVLVTLIKPVPDPYEQVIIERAKKLIQEGKGNYIFQNQWQSGMTSWINPATKEEIFFS